MQLPWEPLYTIERSGLPEVTVYGIISILDGQGRSLLSVGDVNHPLWSRSTLKAWQLLGHYHLLKESYPALQPAHFALMESSHNGESFHLQRLKEIMEIGSVDDSMLQCPPAHSWHAGTRAEQKRLGEGPKSLFNGCSGKHFGFLMAMKKKGLNIGDYLNPSGEQFKNLRAVLAWLLKRKTDQFATTTDGCRLPNYALTASELSTLYCLLLRGVAREEIARAPEQLRPMLENVQEVGNLMSRYPDLVGGSRRLDTDLMQRQLNDDKELTIVAKEGAEGLLTVGIGSCSRYPDGLGIVIKVSSGFHEHHFEVLIKTILEQLELRTASTEVDERNKHIVTKFHFRVQERQTA